MMVTVEQLEETERRARRAAFQDGWQTWMDYVMPALFGILCAFGPLWTARNQDFLRGYLYAALFPIGAIGLSLSGVALGYNAIAGTCLLVGVFSAVIGAVYFTRFLGTFTNRPDS